MVSFRGFLILFSISFLALSGCSEQKGSDTPSWAACGNSSRSLVNSFHARYAPASKDLLVSATFKRDEYPTGDFFYFKGKLADGAELTEPIGLKPAIVVKCQDPECQKFGFRLESASMKYGEDVTVERHEVARAETSRKELSTVPKTATGPAGEAIGPYRDTEQTWHYSLEKGVVPEASSVTTACLGGKAHSTVYLAVNENTTLGQSFYAISVAPGLQKFSVDSLQNVEGNPILSAYGAMEFKVITETLAIKITSPSAEAKLILK